MQQVLPSDILPTLRASNIHYRLSFSYFFSPRNSEKNPEGVISIIPSIVETRKGTEVFSKTVFFTSQLHLPSKQLTTKNIYNPIEYCTIQLHY